MEDIIEREYQNKEDLTKTIQCGKITLIDCFPRIVPKGRYCDYSVVRAARVSYDLGLKSEKEDNSLIDYMFRNEHTSPFEMCEFLFLIETPLAIATHLLRHRTANLNQFSQRYSEVPEEDTFYYPSHYENGIRLQSQNNKQLSVIDSNSDKLKGLKDLAEKAEEKIREIYDIYQKMNNLGCAREVSRFYLPQCTMTKMYYKMDLHNICNLLEKRYDIDHAQYETYLVAKAMYELIKPLVPQTINCFDNYISKSITFAGDEINAIQNKRSLNSSKRRNLEFEDKTNKLNL